jgi:hypothetical protein
MNTETKQIRFNDTPGSFPESRRFHSMAVRGIGALADVSGGLFGGETGPRAAVIARLSGRRTRATFLAAA